MADLAHLIHNRFVLCPIQKALADRMDQSVEILTSSLAKIKTDPNLSALTIELQKVVELLRNQDDKSVQKMASQASPKKSPSLKPKESVAAAKNVKLLSDEVTKLKTMNEQLIAKVEEKMNQIKRLEEQINRKRVEEHDQPDSRDVIVTSQTGHAYTLPSVEDIRRMEADLKRKTDLLSEVKVLLKQVTTALKNLAQLDLARY